MVTRSLTGPARLQVLKHPLPVAALLRVPSESLGLTMALLAAPFSVKLTSLTPFLARKSLPQGPHWGRSCLPQRIGVFLPAGGPGWCPWSPPSRPGASPRSVCSASVALSPQGLANRGGEGQGSAHASTQVFAPSFSGVKCKGGFSWWSFFITGFLLGDAGMRWS